tara:strand:+ start:347 stop:685 length:339 start_codon:yes stop_codon:yes gene_type:complete
MAAPTNQGLITEAGLFIITESGDYIVTEAFISEGGGGRPKEIKKDSNELWEVGASIYSINDNALKERVNIKKYIMEENDIKVSIGENVSLRKPDIINESIIVKLLSTRIKER